MVCTHPKKSTGHCWEMICDNYINKCPKHSFHASGDEVCPLEVTVAVRVENIKQVNELLVDLTHAEWQVGYTTAKLHRRLSSEDRATYTRELKEWADKAASYRKALQDLFTTMLDDSKEETV